MPFLVVNSKPGLAVEGLISYGFNKANLRFYFRDLAFSDFFMNVGLVFQNLFDFSNNFIVCNFDYPFHIYCTSSTISCSNICYNCITCNARSKKKFAKVVIDYKSANIYYEIISNFGKNLFKPTFGTEEEVFDRAIIYSVVC